ncbi:MAG: hypothetical protein Q8Q97_02175, partial [bacterium]|nr:hypothetical protein [bacterium]
MAPLFYATNINKSGGPASWQGGQAALLAVVLILLAVLILIGTVSGLAFRGAKIAELDYKSRRSYFLSESGSEDAAYRLISGKNLPSSYELSLYGATTNVSVTNVLGGKEILSSAGLDTLQRAVKSFFKTGTGASFNYGVQIGNGGLVMENNSQVNGSVYSNGNVVGNNNPAITGDAFLVGASTISGVSVGGEIKTGQPSLPMPISDAQLDAWETDAAAGGIHTAPCPYVLSSGTTVIGPKKIACDMDIKNTAVVTLTGTLWVSGNLIIQNSAVVGLDSSFGGASGLIIVDDPLNRSSKSILEVKNYAEINGSGTSGSYEMLVS